MLNHRLWHKFLGGIFLVLMWIAATSFTIFTDKNLIMGLNHESIQLSWEVLKMPYLLVTGGYQGFELVATMGALMIFSAYVTLSILVLYKGSKALYSLVMIIITVDGIANFQFFWSYQQMPFVFQCLLTGLIFVTLVHLGPKGLELVMEGISEIGAIRSAGREDSFA